MIGTEVAGMRRIRVLALSLVMVSGCLDLDTGRAPLTGGEPQPEVDPLPPPPPNSAPACGPEVHVFGAYEPRPDGGSIAVRIERPGTHVLVLSAYEPTRFKIEETPGAYIQEIVLIGYHRHTLAGLDRIGHPIAVERRSFDERTLGDLPPCGYSLPYNGMGCYTDGILSYVERTRGAVRSFYGAYNATHFVLRSDLSAQVDVDVAAGYELYSYRRPCGDPTAADWPRRPEQVGRR
jgi:hypothetical protein